MQMLVVMYITQLKEQKKDLVEGEELVVQISREALKAKDPSVTTNLNFTGKYAILTTENQQIGISSKLDKEENRLYTDKAQKKQIISCTGWSLYSCP